MTTPVQRHHPELLPHGIKGLMPYPGGQRDPVEQHNGSGSHRPAFHHMHDGAIDHGEHPLAGIGRVAERSRHLRLTTRGTRTTSVGVGHSRGGGDPGGGQRSHRCPGDGDLATGAHERPSRWTRGTR